MSAVLITKAHTVLYLYTQTLLQCRISEEIWKSTNYKILFLIRAICFSPIKMMMSSWKIYLLISICVSLSFREQEALMRTVYPSVTKQDRHWVCRSHQAISEICSFQGATTAKTTDCPPTHWNRQKTPISTSSAEKSVDLQAASFLDLKWSVWNSDWASLNVFRCCWHQYAWCRPA